MPKTTNLYKAAGVSGLTESELDAELEKGFTDLVRSNTKPAEKVFSDIRRDYGIWNAK